MYTMDTIATVQSRLAISNSALSLDHHSRSASLIDRPRNATWTNSPATMISNARGGITVAASSGMPTSFKYRVKASSKGISMPAEAPAMKAFFAYVWLPGWSRDA